jgi:hypothetical protein
MKGIIGKFNFFVLFCHLQVLLRKKYALVLQLLKELLRKKVIFLLSL